MRFLARIACYVAGHQYRVTRYLTPHSRRVGCPRCGGDWAMNDDARVIVKWSPEFDAFYAEYAGLLSDSNATEHEATHK